MEQHPLPPPPYHESENGPSRIVTPVLPLGYEPPRPAPRQEFTIVDYVLHLLRRAVFALGVGLLAYGVSTTFGARVYRDNQLFVGWGAALIALVVPFPGLWKHWPTRK